MNIAEELNKRMEKKYEESNASISIKKCGAEVSVNMAGDVSTLLVLLTEAVATVIHDTFGKDKYFANMMVGMFSEGVKKLLEGKDNADRS